MDRRATLDALSFACAATMCALAATACGNDAPAEPLGAGRYYGVLAGSKPLFVDCEIGQDVVQRNGTKQPGYLKVTLMDPWRGCGGVPDACLYYTGQDDNGVLSAGLEPPGGNRSSVYVVSGRASARSITGTLSWPDGSGSFLAVPWITPPGRRCGTFSGDDEGTFTLFAIQGHAAIAAWKSRTTGASSLLSGSWAASENTLADLDDEIQRALTLDGGSIAMRGGMYRQTARVGVGLGTGTWSSGGAKGTWMVDFCGPADSQDAGSIDAADAASNDAAADGD